MVSPTPAKILKSRSLEWGHVLPIRFMRLQGSKRSTGKTRRIERTVETFRPPLAYIRADCSIDNPSQSDLKAPYAQAGEAEEGPIAIPGEP